MFLFLARLLCFLPIAIFHPTTIKGRKNIPKGKAILCINHLSNWDMVLYYLNTTKKVSVMAKQELFDNKILGWALKCCGAFPVERETTDLKAIKKGLKVLNENKKLMIFPEGKRMFDDSTVLGELKNGVALFAIRTKSPIVPIWIEKRPKLFRRSYYHIGQPYELSEFYGKKIDAELLSKATEVVRQKMLELRELVLQKKNKKKKKKIKEKSN